jgi:hypothetical protein
MISDFLCPDFELSESDTQQLSKALPKKQKDAGIFASGICCVTGEWGDNLLRRELAAKGFALERLKLLEIQQQNKFSY